MLWRNLLACICVFQSRFQVALRVLVLACAAAKDKDGNDSHWRVLLYVHVRVSEMELQTQAVPGLSGKGQYLDLAGKAYKPSFIDWLLLCVCLTLFLCPWATHCNRSSVHIFARVCVHALHGVCVYAADYIKIDVFKCVKVRGSWQYTLPK